MQTYVFGTFSKFVSYHTIYASNSRPVYCVLTANFFIHTLKIIILEVQVLQLCYHFILIDFIFFYCIFTHI